MNIELNNQEARDLYYILSNAHDPIPNKNIKNIASRLKQILITEIIDERKRIRKENEGDMKK